MPSFFTDGNLQGWFAQLGAVELQAAANYSRYLFEFAFFILLCSLCHADTGQSEYKQCTQMSVGVNKPLLIEDS